MDAKVTRRGIADPFRISSFRRQGFLLLFTLGILACADSSAMLVPLDEVNADQPRFYGLAAFYNTVDYYVVSDSDFAPVTLEEAVTLDPGETFVALGRVEALVARGEEMTVSITETDLVFTPVDPSRQPSYAFIPRDDLGTVQPALTGLRYTRLWAPLAALAWAVEWLLLQIQAYLFSNWGLAIVALAVVLKVLLFPLSLMTVRAQRKVGEYQSKLAPKLAEIRKNHSGEEAHNRVIAAHKELGITPFFTLKPMAATLIQIPVLIAVFNALGEMPQLFGKSFLWIEDLSLPDAVATLPITIPLLGNTLNLLPFLMTAVSVLATLLFTNRSAPAQTVKHQKRNLYIMSAAFFILFYPFPASMVLYWTLSNLLQIAQQRIVQT